MNQNVLVIGGSSGVGLEIVRLLSARGDHVTTASRTQGGIADLPGVSWQSYDVTDRNATLTLPETLDGFVYCPGTIQLKPFQRLTDDDFQSELEVNFLGAVRAIRLAYPALKKSGAGSIVLFSTVAVGTGLPYHAGIASAKGAIEGLSRTLAAEFAPVIRVNCLALSYRHSTCGRLVRQRGKEKGVGGAPSSQADRRCCRGGGGGGFSPWPRFGIHDRSGHEN